ncbi:MAG: c-type cytochrome [Opitutales bacterium]
MSGDDPNEKHFPPTGESRETFEGNRFEDDRLQKVHSQLMREKEEPSENFSYPPLVFVFVFMLLAFWAGIYLVHYSGGFSPFVFDERTSPGEGAAAAPAERDPLQIGRGVYVRQCSACHQQDGNGLPGVYPPVANSDWVKDDPRRLTKLVLNGLQGEVVVNGESYNNAMTAFGGVLSDSEIAAVLTYLRVSEDFGNDSHAVDAELVSEVRSEYGGRSEAWTQAELEAIHGPVTGEWSPSAEEDGDEEDETAEDEAPAEESA